MNYFFKMYFTQSIFLLVLLVLSVSSACANSLKDISYSALPGNKVQVVLTLEETATKPASFSTDSPARIAIDLNNTNSLLAKKTQTIGIGMARSVTAIEAGHKTRVVLNLVSAVNHSIRTEKNKIIVDISGGHAANTSHQSIASSVMTTEATNKISGIDFRRGKKGKAEVIIKMSNANTVVDMKSQGEKLILDFVDSGLSSDMASNLDVSDFATPVQSIKATPSGNNVRIEVDAIGEYDHLAYQLNDTYVLEVRPMSKSEIEKAKLEKRIFTGDRLSLNFQDIEVRSVLQLLADFTGLNMVVSDTVTGNVTLRLKNVPWDQAMDIILRTKGLSMRQTENVVLIAPTAEITNWEKSELEAKKEIQELAPLRTELVQINYAKAADMTAILKGETNQLLSKRGSVTIDERTNSLLIQDTADKLEEIRALISKLDIPVRQVMIESRIVSATDNFAKDLGVRLGMTQGTPNIQGGLLNNATANISGALPGSIDANSLGQTTGNLLVDLGATGATSGIDLVLAKLGSHILSLELQAMQADDKGEIISNPRVITADKSTATIKEGVEIAYVSSDGTTVSTEFKEAVLKLEVTPQITPDDRIMMDLLISKDAATVVANSAEPAISKQEVETTVLVDNGETVVLGGVFQRTKTEATSRVPFFGDLPYVGFLFKQKNQVDNNRELLIFVTPKILKDSMKLN